jgi:serine/threonine protein kinase
LRAAAWRRCCAHATSIWAVTSVPVYDIGRFGNRPFFTMRLVKGHTLAALLAERSDLAADRPRFLAIALQVAQTLAYAHAKGVIHRNLKPANVMVGAFGEVQVMDWGLAKVLAEGGLADEERASRAHQEPEDVTRIRTARSTGSAGGPGTETEAGSLLGTPPGSMRRSGPDCGNKLSTGSAPTWPCAPGSSNPHRPLTRRRRNRRCGTGSRTPTWLASATRRRWRNCRPRTARRARSSGQMWPAS